MKKKHRRKSASGLESSQTLESARNRNKSWETKSPRFRLQPAKGDESRIFFIYSFTNWVYTWKSIKSIGLPGTQTYKSGPRQSCKVEDSSRKSLCHCSTKKHTCIHCWRCFLSKSNIHPLKKNIVSKTSLNCIFKHLTRLFCSFTRFLNFCIKYLRLTRKLVHCRAGRVVREGHFGFGRASVHDIVGAAGGVIVLTDGDRWKGVQQVRGTGGFWGPIVNRPWKRVIYTTNHIS